MIGVASFCLVVSTVVDEEGDEDEVAAVESEESDTEEAMETETDTKTATVETAKVVAMETDVAETAEGVAMETNATESTAGPKAVPVKKPTPSTRAPAAPSGLPQNKAELEALITSIHATVQNAVLPRLHKCLTAKVHTRSNTHQLYSLSGIFWNVSPTRV